MAGQQLGNNGEHNGVSGGNNHIEGNTDVAEDGSQEEIFLDNPTMTPLLPVQQAVNGEGYGGPEGGPQNGWTFAGLAGTLPTPHQAGGWTNTAAGGFQNNITLNSLDAATLSPPHVPLNALLNSTDVPVTDLLYLLASVEEHGQKPKTARRQRGPQPRK